MSASRRDFLLLAALGGTALAFPGVAGAVSCAAPDFEQLVLNNANVIAGEIVSVTRTKGRPERYKVAILARLKDGGLFASSVSRFDLPAHTGWDLLEFKRGRILIFFFGDRIGIKCNFPIAVA